MHKRAAGTQLLVLQLVDLEENHIADQADDSHCSDWHCGSKHHRERLVAGFLLGMECLLGLERRRRARQAIRTRDDLRS